MRKKLTTLLVSAMLLLTCTTASLAFHDVSGHWASNVIDEWSKNGTVSGYEDGSFRPDNSITRAEFAAIVDKVCALSANGQDFSDVKVGDWYYTAVKDLAGSGITAGYEDGTFRPANPITRQEAAVMLAKAFHLTAANTDLGGKFTDHSQVAHWARTSVAALVEAGGISGYPDGTFRPQGHITRAEVVTILDALCDKSADQKDDGPIHVSGGSKKEPVTVDDVVSIRAYSELTYYAVGVTQIEITYKNGVDLSDLKAEDIHIIDRGYLYPEFGQLPIQSMEINGQVVTLTIDRDTTANGDNALIYAGENATGARTKDDVYGVHATFSWYRENDGDIVKAARAFQYRDTELRLWHTGESIGDAICQADTMGKYIEGSKFAPTYIEYFTDAEMASFTKDGQTHNYTKGGFMTLEELGIQIPSSSGIEGDYVKAYVAFPEGYDPNQKYPIILSLPGNSAAEWDIVENGEIIASNPYGATFFNGSAINWYDKGVDAIALYVSHHYHSQYTGAVKDATDLTLEGYNYAKDDMAIVDYFIEHYGAKENHVVVTGDSRGTMAGSDLVQAFPGRISTFLCINGDWGLGGNKYTDYDYATAAKHGTSVWCIDGEQDSSNIPSLTRARAAYAEAGYTQEEIDDMLRHTDLATEYNYYWGETDHSATKFVYWYLMDELYYGPGHIENGEIVYDDTTITSYQSQGKLGKDGTYNKVNYDYDVYTDTLIDWVMSEDREIDVLPEVTVDDIQSIQPISELNYYAVGVSQIEITYKDGVDLSGIDATDYQIMDRGYLKPNFGFLPIQSAEVDGQVVTLTIDRDTTANSQNALIYTGANATGERAKDDIFGLHATFSWYREKDGDIVEAARAFQYRDTELVLWHTGETVDDAIYQADITTGTPIEGGKFAPAEIEFFTDVEMASFTKDGQTHNYTVGGFMTLEELGIQIPSTSGIEGDYVKAYVAFPDGYDPNKEYPIILSLPGNNAAEWDIVENGEIIAGNPYGPTFFNGSAINWYDKGVDIISVYVSHRYYSQLAGAVADPTDLSLEGYNYVKDDMALIDYFIDNYNAKANHVILTGDSRGTKAASNVILAYPGRISTFLCINGSWGGWGQWGRTYNDEDYTIAGQNGLSVWCIDGELDFDNVKVIRNARELYAQTGLSSEEVADKLRISSLATEYNYYWGETDHSATKFVYWYLMDKLYHGPGHIENGQIVYDDTSITSYQLEGKMNKDGSYVTAGFDYDVYTDTLIDWVMSEDREIQVKEDAIAVTVDGKNVQTQVYATEDGPAMELDDLAALLAGSESAFDVAVDKNNMTYKTHLGAEFKGLEVIQSEPPAKAPTAWTLTIDGVAAQLVRCHDEGEAQHFNLRDLAVLFGFEADYDAEAQTLAITTGTGYSLDLDADNYETGSITVYGQEIPYRVYTQVYVSNPQCVAQEVMKIYVPETATENSPIFMPLKTGAHNHADMAELVDVDESNINKPSSGTVGTGGMQAASYLMSKGWVVVSAAARGLDTLMEVDGVTTRAGLAPHCVTDLKAAIRYLHHNDDVLPGDPDKVVVTGTSGGGTITSVLGASGNAALYDPYLKEIGAAEGSDAVFAAIPYCPVADIDHQGLGYEWMFQGLDVESRSGNMKTLSHAISEFFASYVNGLALTDKGGNALTLDSETLTGSFKEYYCAQYAAGLTHHMHLNGYVAENGTLTEAGQKYFDQEVEGMRGKKTGLALSDLFTWSAEEGGKAAFQMERYNDLLKVYNAKLFFMKGCPSFDNGLVYGDVTKSSIDSINNLFDTDPTDLGGWSHFEMNLGSAVANANAAIGSEYFKSELGSFEISDESQKHIAMYNPMYYIKDFSGVAKEGMLVNSYADDLYGSSDVAPYWHLRVGTWDHLVSPASETAFSLTLNSSDAVKECNFMIYWDQPHTGWFDNTEMVAWLLSLPELQ